MAKVGARYFSVVTTSSVTTSSMAPSLASHPVVLVTAPLHTEEGRSRVRLGRAYLSALEHVGVVPVVMGPPHDPAEMLSVLSRVDGVLLTGGEDVAPERYGAVAHPALGEVCAERDAWEIAVVREARRLRLPTFAICRGVQLANVAFGGTLIQDIPSERRGALDHSPEVLRLERVHGITVVAGSRVERILGANPAPVNSIHHQAIDRVAPGFVVTAWASDGIAEALESERSGEDTAWWMLGVQWHPEELEGLDSPRTGLFAAFAEAVGRVDEPQQGSKPRSGQ